MKMMGQKRLDARIIKASIGDLHSCTLIMLMAIKFCMTLCATWASLPLCLLAVSSCHGVYSANRRQKKLFFKVAHYQFL